MTVRSAHGQGVPDMSDNGKPPTASRLYLEPIARLIEREIARFTSGEQAAQQSFTNLVKLVRNASEELAVPDVGARPGPPADLRRPCSKLC